MKDRPLIRDMIREAIIELGGRASPKQIKRYIQEKYPNTSPNSVHTLIIRRTVNMPSRVYYPENSRPRRCNDKRYDLFFSLGRGDYVEYDPKRHGEWAIVERNNRLEVVRLASEQTGDGDSAVNHQDEKSKGLLTFLREYLAGHLSAHFPGYRLYRDTDGRSGIAYPTDLGVIDVLAKNDTGNLLVFKIKLDTAANATCGELMRNMGWVRKYLGQGRQIRGVIVAQDISKDLLYAAMEHPGIELYQYHLNLNLCKVTSEQGA